LPASKSRFAPVLVTVGALALLALPSAWTLGGMSVLDMPLEVSAAISAGLIGIFSAWLWIHAAWYPNDYLSNAAAAGFSGATAAFGVDSITFPSGMTLSQPWITTHWAAASYGFGWLIVVAVVITIWARFRSP